MIRVWLALRAISVLPPPSWYEDHSIIWAPKAMEHSKLRINLEQNGRADVTATYTMKGAKVTIPKVLAACGNPLPERTE